MKPDVFWSKVDKTGDCWLWTGQRWKNGYGRITCEGKEIGTHRYSYALEHGPIERGLWVLHKCDNRSCVNPAHLFLGNNADNTADKVSKGRQLRGERAWNARLSNRDVQRIRRMSDKGVRRKDLAKKFGVTPQHISSIVLGDRWNHVPGAGT